MSKYPRIIVTIATLHLLLCVIWLRCISRSCAGPSAPHMGPLNDGVCAAIAKHEMSRRLPGRVNHPNLAARNQLRASERLARARLCFELSSSRPGNGSSQFKETRSPKQIAHTGNTSVFEPCVLCVLCVVCVVQMIQDTACLSRRVPTCS